jgi:ribosomal protein S18 acetylase RimI-like enzyme
MIEIVSAQSGKALDHLITLSLEYVNWMNAQIQAHYPKIDISGFAAEHDYDDIRRKFPGEHIAPDGCLFIAVNDNQVCGCVALGRLTKTIGELRTLYVLPECRGAGVGRSLVEAALGEARKLGYGVVRLDTLAFMESALSLYRSLGFRDITPYRDIASPIKQHVCFLELELKD